MNDDISARLQASLTPQRKILIAEAEKAYIETQGKQRKKTDEEALWEILEEAILDWIEKQEKTNRNKSIKKVEK